MTDGIDAFWSYWNEHRDAIERAIEGGTLLEWVVPLSAHVKAIDARLDWEMGAGLEAAHYFCVSSKGDPIRRIVAERWRSRGPAADAVFEYHAARPGGGLKPGTAIRFGDVEVGGDDFLFALEIDEARRRVHVAAWHPALRGASEELAMTAIYIWLDTVLGEDEVERWIGAVELAGDGPEPTVGFDGLLDAVRAIAGKEETFTLLRGTLPDGMPLFVTANLGIKRVDHLLMELHFEVELELLAPTGAGLTTNHEADALNRAEDALVDALGSDAVYIGRETGAGRRTMHFHAAVGGPALARIDAWAAEQPWTSEVRSQLDPEWSILGRW